MKRKRDEIGRVSRCEACFEGLPSDNPGVIRCSLLEIGISVNSYCKLSGYEVQEDRAILRVGTMSSSDIDKILGLDIVG